MERVDCLKSEGKHIFLHFKDLPYSAIYVCQFCERPIIVDESQ